MIMKLIDTSFLQTLPEVWLLLFPFWLVRHKLKFFHENLIPFDAEAKFDDELAETLTSEGLDWILMAGIIWLIMKETSVIYLLPIIH